MVDLIVGACGRTQTPVDKAIGYTCVRPANHSGPCAMVFVNPEPDVPKKPGRWSRFVDAIGEAIGESLFGGGR